MPLIRRSPGFVTIAGIAVAVGLLPMPYGYYMLLRLFFCGISLYMLSSVRRVRAVEKWVLVGLAVLYNPLVPVELGSKLLSSILNIGTVVYFWALNRRATTTPWRADLIPPVPKQRRFEPDLPFNCPHCGQPLRYLAAGDNYVSPIHGPFYLGTDGRLYAGHRPA